MYNVDKYTTLLMHMNDSTFKDEFGHTVINANVSYSKSGAKFGSGGASFNGSSSRFSIANTDGGLDFGSGDYTIDFWLYLTKSGTTQTLLDWRPSSSSGFLILYLNSSNQIVVSSNNGLSPRTLTTFTLGTYTWYHIALVRYNGVVNVYVNGSQSSPLADTSEYSIASNVGVGKSLATGSGGYLGGYIDELIVSKGIARWTSNFTPPTDQYSKVVFLIQDGTELKTINSGSLTTVCNTTDSDTIIESAFNNSGITDLSIWNDNLANQVVNSTFKVVMYRNT